VLLDNRKKVSLIEGFEAPPTNNSDKNSVNTLMSVEHWWNDADMGERKYLEENLDTVSLYLVQISHGLACNRTRTFIERRW